jgi:hypothetical protein
MGVVATHLGRRAAGSGSTGGRRHQSGEHPLLALQRTAGNKAVTALVQRRTERSGYLSKVALAPADNLYKGKCDAVPTGAQVRYKWSRGLTGKDVSIIFECGPQSFEFSTFAPYFGDRFPWGMELVGDGSAWVVDEVSNALDAIRDDIDDVGSKFWGGYHVILDLLTKDLKGYCGD